MLHEVSIVIWEMRIGTTCHDTLLYPREIRGALSNHVILHIKQKYISNENQSIFIFFKQKYTHFHQKKHQQNFKRNLTDSFCFAMSMQIILDSDFNFKHNPLSFNTYNYPPQCALKQPILKNSKDKKNDILFVFLQFNS